MFQYEKILQYPINIKTPNARYAKIIIDQYGGPDGELGASLRYLSQRFSMPYPEVQGLLTDIGTEELGHLEMIGTIVYQLTRNLSMEEIKKSGFDAYFVTHTTGVYPASAAGVPFTAAYLQSKGDIITDLHEDMAAEGTTAKEQPVFQMPEKALFHAVFGTFDPRTQNRRLRPHKNNKSQKYGRTSCFQGKLEKHRQGFKNKNPCRCFDFIRLQCPLFFIPISGFVVSKSGFFTSMSTFGEPMSTFKHSLFWGQNWGRKWGKYWGHL